MSWKSVRCITAVSVIGLMWLVPPAVEAQRGGLLLPVSKGSLSQESMMDRFEMMTSNSEQVVNGAVDAEKSLELGRANVAVFRYRPYS